MHKQQLQTTFGRRQHPARRQQRAKRRQGLDAAKGCAGVSTADQHIINDYLVHAAMVAAARANMAAEFAPRPAAPAQRRRLAGHAVVVVDLAQR